MKRRKLTASEVQRMSGQHTSKMLRCSKCENLVKTDNSVVSVICWKCTCDMVPFEAKVVAPKSDKPAGWRFMKEFVDKDGTVYHTGVEVPDLKGTLPITDVEAIKAQQKEKRKDKKAHKHEREEKREENLRKEFEKKKELKKKLEEKEAEEALKNKFIGDE